MYCFTDIRKKVRSGKPHPLFTAFLKVATERNKKK